VVSANITPDIDTGTGKWSREFFLKKFYDYKQYDSEGPPLMGGPQSFTLMPWLPFSRKTEDELTARWKRILGSPIRPRPGNHRENSSWRAETSKSL
jgi:hypothetical protein